MSPYKSYDIEEMKKMLDEMLHLGLPRYKIYEAIGRKYGLSTTRCRVILTPGQTLQRA